MPNIEHAESPTITAHPDGALLAVVPAYNAQEFVANAIGCLLADACIKTIIVVNDGSTDATRDCIEQCRAELPDPGRVILIDQPNAGVSAARNRGIEQALQLDVGRQVVFLDADDTWFAHSGSVVHERFAACPEAALLVAARMEIYPGTHKAARCNAPHSPWTNAPMTDRAIVFEPVAFFGASGLCVARRVLEAGVRFDREFQVGEDRDFACRALEHGPLLVSADPLLTVRLFETAQRRNLTGAANMERWLSDHLRLVQKHRDVPGADDRLRRQTDWLLNHALRLSVRHGMELVGEQMWSRYAALYREMGWRRPWKVIRRRILPASVMRLFDR
ncbi:MAG: glycosyltransferase [Phycisphaerales bacterium]|nr:glycosyltransferase [Phycisphaerales bacterium]